MITLRTFRNTARGFVRLTMAIYPCCRSQALISACSKSTQEPVPKWS